MNNKYNLFHWINSFSRVVLLTTRLVQFFLPSDCISLHKFPPCRSSFQEVGVFGALCSCVHHAIMTAVSSYPVYTAYYRPINGKDGALQQHFIAAGTQKPPRRQTVSNILPRGGATSVDFLGWSVLGKVLAHEREGELHTLEMCLGNVLWACSACKLFHLLRKCGHIKKGILKKIENLLKRWYHLASVCTWCAPKFLYQKYGRAVLA